MSNFLILIWTIVSKIKLTCKGNKQKDAQNGSSNNSYIIWSAPSNGAFFQWSYDSIPRRNDVLKRVKHGYQHVQGHLKYFHQVLRNTLGKKYLKKIKK